MLFTSPVFLFFFLPVLLALYYLPGRRSSLRFRNSILLAASLAFYAYGEPRVIFILLGEILISHLASRWLSPASSLSPIAKKALLSLSIAVNLGTLGYFKYLGFFSRSASSLFGLDLPSVDIALPIGISFFTFQIISYTIDVFRGEHPPQRNFFDLCLYVSFFPQLIAGPIVRYKDIERELAARKESTGLFAEGAKRFIIGLGKKMLLANHLAIMADILFTEAGLGLCHSAATAWIGAIAYALQIYFDFSGYSDMAIGLGKLFGFNFRENFNYPYAAASVTDFWRRWHMSLSTWFRDYLYIPLGGNRVRPARGIFNLFAVWLLTGLWHGANYTFVLWGLFYFACLLAERSLNLQSRRGIAMRAWTLIAVLVAWVLFRAETLHGAISYIGMMFGSSGKLCDFKSLSYVANSGFLLPVALLCAFPSLKWARGCARGRILGVLSSKTMREAFLCAIFLLSILAMAAQNYNPFIYFNF